MKDVGRLCVRHAAADCTGTFRAACANYSNGIHLFGFIMSAEGRVGTEKRDVKMRGMQKRTALSYESCVDTHGSFAAV